MSRVSRRLMERLRELGFELSPEARIRRFYPGRHQRSAGAWLWCVDDPKHLNLSNLGSVFTVTELARAPHLSVLRHRGTSSWEVFPEAEKPK